MVFLEHGDEHGDRGGERERSGRGGAVAVRVVVSVVVVVVSVRRAAVFLAAEASLRDGEMEPLGKSSTG